VAIGAVAAPAGGADCDGAPNPPNPGDAGAVVVVVAASPGQDVDPDPGAQAAEGTVVVVLADFLPDFGAGHFVGEDPDLFFDFLVVVAVVDAGEAALCSW
jgi:hypothetical protein